MLALYIDNYRAALSSNIYNELLLASRPHAGQKPFRSNGVGGCLWRSRYAATLCRRLSGCAENGPFRYSVFFWGGHGHLRAVLQDALPRAAHEGHRRGGCDTGRADWHYYAGYRVQRRLGHRPRLV